MAGAGRPVFFDPSGRRRRRFALAVAAFAALFLLAIGVFIVSIDVVPAQPLLPVEAELPQMKRLPPPRDSALDRTGRTLAWYARRLAGQTRSAKTAGNTPLAIGFYVPWDVASAASLQRYAGELDWVIPHWLALTGADHRIQVFRDTAGREVLNRTARRPLILPMIQNILNGDWEGTNTARLLHDPAQRKWLLDRLEPWLAANGAGGIFFDFEQLPASAQADYRTFLKEANDRFDRRNWVVAVAVPVGDADWDVKAYAAVVDRVFLMAYDEHEASGAAGPIASRGWFARVVADAARGVPRDKLVVAIGNYGYDWHDGKADAIAVEDLWQRARDLGTLPSFDRESGNTGMAYMADTSRHTMWALDAVSAYDELRFLQQAGINGVALWRLGSEDPGLWSLFGRSHRALPSPAALDTIPAGTGADIEGQGQILKITGRPAGGQRRITVAKAGSIADVQWRKLPQAYVVGRSGLLPGEKKVALTFDDGPDAEWTPPILDVLKRYKVPATFFIIGNNALTERGLLTRIVDEGNEVGNHTYTHPNLAGLSDGETELELNTTQRLFQAFTGRSLKLFRAPYFDDSSPTTADELNPALIAQERGYIEIGQDVDPSDWQRPDVDYIVNKTIAAVTGTDPDQSGNIILLHDSGGDRSQTVAALPRIIEELQARGYKFVRISELAGLSRDAVMPPISASDRFAAEADLFLFGSLGNIVWGLWGLFLFAITIGIVRAVTLSALALIQARRENRTIFPPIDPSRFVTVMIPAFNEEAVIEQSVRGVLASRDVAVEVIVIDDGSNDRTSEVVRAAFADEPRVRLLTLENGGKARALNRGIALATGEIVIALDADTQFEPATIARLARWFDDPTLGAVAGNAKVGNRVNLVTCWQALEYITAQNLERRALARLNAMTVVPGAVGAWRLAAIRGVGGYPADTLAEDQDLTIAIQRAGWKVHYDQYAVAWTESPETFRGLARQRFRWAYGTLQCLWKHGAIIRTGRPRGLARVGLPQAILFQIVLAAISPIIDLALVVSLITTALQVAAHGWAQTAGTLERMLVYWLVFTLIDLLSAVIAFALERRERWWLLLLLLPQRIGYRQVMYYVVLKALTQALRGPQVGWGKLQRTGRVKV